MAVDEAIEQVNCSLHVSNLGEDQNVSDGSSSMKLYVTFTSPYARLARILVLEKALEDRVEIVAAKTRVADSPYYRVRYHKVDAETGDEVRQENITKGL